LNFSRIPYRETEDYIADAVAVLAQESYENQSKDIFSLCDLGCGNGIVLKRIIEQLNSSEIEREIKVHLIDIDHKCIDQTLEGLKKVSPRNLSVSVEIASIFEKDPQDFNFSFLYLFWRKSDVDSFLWKTFSPGRIVSYKHEIQLLRKNLSKVVKSNSNWSMYENLYVYDC
tara:strand:- start:169 stop:681 length:513 start_codon:yes stop_codon:yes gene_type:complete